MPLELERTVRVDPKGSLDRTSIQEAITYEVPDYPDVHWTVLVYAGTYEESVTLGSHKGNVDIVGVDRDGVVIQVTDADGVTITGSGSRKNSIRNLTIRTAGDEGGHGIVVQKTDTENPSDIEISDVVIEASGTDKVGMDLAQADGVRVHDCKVKSTAGHGIILGDDCEVSNVTVEALGEGKQGVQAATKSHIRILDCTVTAASVGLMLSGMPDDVQVSSCEIRAGGRGVVTDRPQGVLIRDCHIVGDGEINPSGHPQAFFVEWLAQLPTGDLTVQDCRIEATSQSSSPAEGVFVDVAEKGVRFVNCEISARNSNENGGGARGVYADTDAADIKVIGGSIVTSAAAAKETDVWDLVSTTANGWPAMSGTRCSKWKGPIKSAERPRPIVQRTLNVSQADDDAVLPATALTPEEQKIDAGITNPDAYRTLSVTLSGLAPSGLSVYVQGTDWAGAAICEEFTLVGAGLLAGVKPFKTVTTIWLPGTNASGLTVSVGVTNKLGLYHPISSEGNVIEQNRKTTQDDWYKVYQARTVDAVYATVEPGAVNGGDSFEWMILTSS